VEWKRDYLNIPNTLSVSRIVLLPILFVLVFSGMRNVFLIAYIIVASTDYLDGRFARRFNQSSEIGKTLDSVADLVFYLSTAFFLYYLFPTVIDNNIYLLYAMFAFLGASFIFSWIRIGKPTLMHTSLLRLNAVLVFFVFCLSFFFDTTYLATGILLIYLVAFAEEMLLWGFFGDVDRDATSFYAVWKERRSRS